MRPQGWLVLATVFAVPLIGGCERTLRNMYDQPKYKPLAASTLWPDGRSARVAPEGVVARAAGGVAETSSGRLGDVPVNEAALQAPANAPTAAPRETQTIDRAEWTLAVLTRGRSRYDIDCAPCHGPAGNGDGMVVRRGFPRPPSLHDERLRMAPDAQLYAVITDGHGRMFPFADRLSPSDRRGVVAYVRALQLSQHAVALDLPRTARETLESLR